RVLFDGIALRHKDGGGNTLAPCGERYGLAVIAARRCDDTVGLAALLAQTHVDETASDLEGARRRVVLMLDPAFALRRFGEKRPGILRGGRHRRIDDALGAIELVTCEHAPP